MALRRMMHPRKSNVQYVPDHVSPCTPQLGFFSSPFQTWKVWSESAAKATSLRSHGSVSATTLGPSSSTSLCDNARGSLTIRPSGVVFEALVWRVQVRVSWPTKIHLRLVILHSQVIQCKAQQTVAGLTKDRILVGHESTCTTLHTRHVCYDIARIQALLLSHPSPQIRDILSLTYKHRTMKSRRPALRVLVKAGTRHRHPVADTAV